MISRHIKKRGPGDFMNSSFVVTNRSNMKKQVQKDPPVNNTARNKPQTLKVEKRHSSQKMAKSSSQEPTYRKKRQNPTFSADPVKNQEFQDGVHKILMQIMNKDENELNAEKTHSLQCFQPREIFNINTHALFQKEKLKDPLESEEESNDDEDEIIELLKHQKDEMRYSSVDKDKPTSIKINLKAYDASKSIERNIKVLRKIIHNTKLATNTNRAASLAQNRKEQLKMSKFIKKDLSLMNQSKIARDTNEAIKYLKKRQPLTVQSTQGVDDEKLFSLPQKQKERTGANQKTRSDMSPSPEQPILQLQHAGQKAKFFRQVGTVQHMLISEPASNDSSRVVLGYGNRGRSLKNASQTDFTIHSNANHTYKSAISPSKGSRSTSEYKNKKQQHPSTYSKTQTTNYDEQNMPRLDEERQKRQMQFESGSTNFGNLFSNYGPMNPSIMHRQHLAVTSTPQIINNITVVSENSQKVAKAHQAYQKHKRQHSAAAGRGSKVGKKITQIPSFSIGESYRLEQNQSDLQINFHDVIAKEISMNKLKQNRPDHAGQVYSSSYQQTQTSSAQRQFVQSGQLPASNQQTVSGIASSIGATQNASRFFRTNRIRNSYENIADDVMGRINETMEQKSQVHVSSEGSSEMPYQTVMDYTRAASPYGAADFINQTPASMMQRKKSSALVKVDHTVLEKMPTLSLMEMMRILDARNEDMGLNKQINTDKCTPDGFEKLALELKTGNGQGPAQRFKDYCDQKCVNRRIVLQGFSLGQHAAEEIASICAVNRNICHVDLSKNNLQDGGVESLIKVIKNNQSIIHLDLTQNNITSKGSKKVFKALASNFSLISLKIGNIENVNKNKVGVKAVPKLNMFLKSSQILSFLDLRSTNLTDAGLIALCDGLIGNITLFNLNLSKNDITSSGIEKFSTILYRTAISELDLSQNPLGNNGVRCLSEHLIEKVQSYQNRQKCKLLKLNLSETKFQENGGYHLFKNLIEYHVLTTLIIDYNQFETKNMLMMTNFIKNSRIHTFSINYCKLGDSGGVALGEAIQTASSIRDVRAMHNQFRDTSAKAIAQAIESNSFVELLDLSNNLINDSGGELLGLAIAVNTNLQCLNLRRNNLRATSGAMFAQSMKSNKTLKHLKLEMNLVNINFLEKINGFIERNNLYILENSVKQLTQDREGYVSTKIDQWRKVEQKRQQFTKKIESLEKKVADRQKKRDILHHDQLEELNELEQGLAFVQQMDREGLTEIGELNNQFKKMEAQGQQNIQAIQNSIASCVFLINNSEERRETQKIVLQETKETFNNQIMLVENQIVEAEKQMRKAKKEMEDVKFQVNQEMMRRQKKQASATTPKKPSQV